MEILEYRSKSWTDGLPQFVRWSLRFGVITLIVLGVRHETLVHFGEWNIYVANGSIGETTVGMIRSDSGGFAFSFSSIVLWILAVAFLFMSLIPVAVVRTAWRTVTFRKAGF